VGQPTFQGAEAPQRQYTTYWGLLSQPDKQELASSACLDDSTKHENYRCLR
jgi:hypothetical protein